MKETEQNQIAENLHHLTLQRALREGYLKVDLGFVNEISDIKVVHCTCKRIHVPCLHKNLHYRHPEISQSPLR